MAAGGLGNRAVGAAQRGDHRADRRGQRLVFPDADHLPPGGREGGIGGPVTLDVPAQLGCPVPLVDGRVPAVLGADVPEAAVDENGNLSGRERYVGTDPRTIVQVESVVFAEPVTL